jgi:cell wall-associated protease
LENIYRGYTYMSGTSMAAPFVSGIAGLLLSVAPNLSAEQVTDAMILGAEDLGTVGWDAEFGHGRVNAMGALMSPVPGLPEAVGEITDPNQELVMFLPSLSNN